MFTAVDYSDLGKSISSTYTSLNKPLTEVSIIPIKNSSGFANYITVLDGKEDAVVPDYMHMDEPDNTNALLSMETHPDPDDGKKNRSIFSIGDNYINTFYIGSVTVVGLFILFRMMQKTK